MSNILNPSSRSSRVATPNTTIAKRLVYFAAALFAVGGTVIISSSIAERNASHHTYNEYKSLNTTVLEEIWVQRRAHAGLKVLGDFIFCTAFLTIVPAIMILVDGISASSKLSSGTRLLTPCFGVVAFTTILSFLSSAGTLSVADWVSTFPPFKNNVATKHLHDGGWGPYQSLEVSYRVQSGQRLWLIIFDELALSIFFFLVGLYTLKNVELKRIVHKCYPWLSFLVALLLHLSFWFGLLRLVNWRVFMVLGGVTGVVTNLILLPIWLVVLGRHLHVFQVVGTNASLLDNQYTTENNGSEMTNQTRLDDKDGLGERI